MNRIEVLSKLLTESLGKGNITDGKYVYNEEKLIRVATPREKLLFTAIKELKDMK